MNKIKKCIVFTSHTLYVGRDISVGTATCYGLDGPRIELRRERNFPHLSKPALGPAQPPFPAGKVARELR